MVPSVRNSVRLCVSVPGSDFRRALSLLPSLPFLGKSGLRSVGGGGPGHLESTSGPRDARREEGVPGLPSPGSLPSLKVRAAGAWLGGSSAGRKCGGRWGDSRGGRNAAVRTGPGPDPSRPRAPLRGGGPRGLSRRDPGGGFSPPRQVPGGPRPPRPTLTPSGSPPRGRPVPRLDPRGLGGHLTLAGNPGPGSGAAELPAHPLPASPPLPASTPSAA